MKEYPASQIRNLAIMGHSGAGKTSFAEACFFNAKLVERLGKVTDGNTVMDFDPEEMRRHISINTSVASLEWDNKKFTWLDTPGDFDFMGEVASALRVADSALIVISAKSGVTVGAEKAVRYLRKAGIPFAFFINKMDEENANYPKVMEDLRTHFGTRVTPMMVPILENNKMMGFVNSFNNHAHKLHPNGDLEDIDLPADMEAPLKEIFDGMMEHVAESSETLMEKYFAGEEFTPAEIDRGIFEAVQNADVYPVFCGSAARNWGVRYTMSKLGDYMPSPLQARPETAVTENGGSVELKVDPKGPLAAVVFKTIADPFVGRISFFRVYSGEIKNNESVYNAKYGKEERITGLATAFGQKSKPTDCIKAGDIGAVTKLTVTRTGDTLSSKAKPLTLPGVEFPPPALSMAVLPVAKGDEEKIMAGLRRIQDEDPSFIVENNPETKQMILSGVGEIHLDVIKAKLKNKFKVDCLLEEAKVPYRETIRKKFKAQGKHKKQSGGHGQYGDVWIEFEPCEEAEKLIFEEKVFGGSVPKAYFPAVEKGLMEAVEHGVLAGYPVVHVKATLLDGSYHDVDSSEMAFKIAANLAYKAAMPKAGPVILEPISNVKIWVPENYLGDIMSDLNKRRGRIMGIEPKSEMQVVSAEVPTSELSHYATDLRSMTQGRAWFGAEFARYEQAPDIVAQKVIADAKQKEND
ncbi:elongation factor G [Mageeibacillus indolicus]|uniref:Translation elongation factor G n=1 Tax=Mageeibacillus indolicus (strain UPII9-5) TaxID=699246 RepID=D3R0P7_MAGIU|nr:elongation factor G [Mageeibacillus indolicus]ADC91596.1 translation elongation factor G [Mageeibacillus indolicus UPII9-5]KFA56951.1 elongation factor G [Mageeibacillus indolicus 0009-5]